MGKAGVQHDSGLFLFKTVIRSAMPLRMGTPDEPSRMRPLIVYSIRVDADDIAQARRLGINLGAVLRRYIKAVVWKEAATSQIKREQEKWTVIKREN